jgi:hypothetical protein
MAADQSYKCIYIKCIFNSYFTKQRGRLTPNPSPKDRGLKRCVEENLKYHFAGKPSPLERVG